MEECKHMIENFAWRTGRSCIFKNFTHLVFVTKYRRNVFTKEMLDDMKVIFSETCKQMDGELIEFGGEDDHVHLLISSPPKTALSNIVGKLKGKSSYILRNKYWVLLKTKLWRDHLWSPSYCAVSCGGAPLEIVKKYVDNQRKPPPAKQIKKSLSLSGRKRPSSLTRP
jgi:putative transposase